MPFVELNKNRISTHDRTGVVAPTLSCAAGSNNRVSIYFRLPRQLVIDLWEKQLFNDGASVRLGILEGTEQDAGFIMLSHSPTGYTFSTSAYVKSGEKESTSSFVSKMIQSAFKFYSPVSVPCPPTDMEYSIDGSAVLIQVPSWFSYIQPPPSRKSLVPVVRSERGRPPAQVNIRNR